MKHLIFYRDIIQSFMLGMVQIGMQPVEYQGSTVYVKANSVEDILAYMSTVSNIDHLEDIHIYNITPKVGEAQDTLEAMLSNFADVPFRFVYWVSDYGEPVIAPNVTYFGSGEATSVDNLFAYLSANTSSTLPQASLEYYWASKGYLSHLYENTTKALTEVFEAIYSLYGLEYVASFGSTMSMSEFLRTHKAPIMRYLEKTKNYIDRHIRSKETAVVSGGYRLVTVSAEAHFNELADAIMLLEQTEDAKVIVLISTIERNRTRITIRTTNDDALDVGRLLTDTEVQGKPNATTVFVPEELTPKQILGGLQSMLEG